MPASWNRFKQNQDRVYGLIRSKREELELSGTEIDRGLCTHRGAFTIALLHPHTVSSVFARQSLHIASMTDAIVYEPWKIHTTLVGLPFSENFAYREDCREHRHILQSLERAARAALEKFGALPCPVRYDVYLPGPEVVVARGEPFRRFGTLVSLLTECAKKEGLTVTPTWGAHVTVSRFATKRSSQDLESLLRFLSTMQGPGLSLSRAIAVGYSLWNAPSGTPKRGDVYTGNFAIHRRFPFLA